MLKAPLSASDSSRGIVAERCPNYWWLPATARMAVRDAVDSGSVDEMVEGYCNDADERIKEQMRDVLREACAELRASDLLQRLGRARHA